MARKVLIQVRRDTAANWTSANPTLAAGEWGFETNTGKVKIGDGSTAWSSLAYFLPGGSTTTVATDAIWDTKGDLAVATAADTASKLAVSGTQGLFLTVDSNASTGLKWDGAPVRAGGSSISGTPGTTVADLQAAANHKLIAWTLFCGQSAAASTQLTVTVTYSDATTTAMTTVANTSSVIIGNAGDLYRLASGVLNASAGLAAKDVTRIQVTTLGTGTGGRNGAISAIEVPR